MVAKSYLAVAALCPAGCGGASGAPTPAKSTQDAVTEAQNHERARRYDLARQRYQRAVDSAPDAVSRGFAAHRFAGALAFWGELEAAATQLEAAVAADPNRASAWHDLGIVRAKLSQPVKSEAALRRAAQLAPKDARPRIALAALLVKTQRFGEAHQTYEALLELDIPERTRSAIHRALELLRTASPSSN